MKLCKLCKIPITKETGYVRNDYKFGFHTLCKYCYNEKYKEKQKCDRDNKRNIILPKQLLEYYIKTQVSLYTIAKKHNCSSIYILETIKRYGLRDSNFENIYKFELKGPRKNMIKCNILKQHLEYNHIILGKHITEIGSELNINTAIIKQHMKYYNIPIKKNSGGRCKGFIVSEETKEKMSKNRKGIINIGCKNGRWNGGSSYEPYCPKWTKELRERIRAFFDYKCILCGKSEKENKRKLSCHHVEYNKQACCDGKLVHFAALCNHCHSKTSGSKNIARQQWEDILHRIIDEIYDGKSYYTKEEYITKNFKY